MFSDVGMNDAVFVILDMNHRRLVLFLPTGQEDTWSDCRDRDLNRLRFEVKMMNPTTEICFIHMADGWKMGSGHRLLLFAPPFNTVQKLLLLWRSQHEAPTVRRYLHLLMFCMSTMYHFGTHLTSGS